MFVYVFFPISMFVYFSNPAIYENDLEELHAKSYIPENMEDYQLLEEAKSQSHKRRLEQLREKVKKDLSGSV